jgi:L-ascorbate metabolism protein UlaG (beta-lactamase superfamily)
MTVLRLKDGEAADFSQGEVYFIGNATTLIRFGGLTILTDPAFMRTRTSTSAFSTPVAQRCS